MHFFLRRQHGDFLLRRDVPEREPRGEAIHLRLGQRISAAEVHGVLRGNDEEQLRQRAALALDADLHFAHCFQQG